ncbi:acyl-CoA carboxylase epsilon subunit [Streptomyces sp. 351MFTsu5.1]|uniref:acyl-CoA carboxylase epsilon subunit n=1 Tax=Streptomyces sp. 351MFTsu5.1 TaxID=1172180 RepID=UPI0003749BE8|nr:acyl-CoA carboxylase epsilon subunit [Streptomyces sp. 351MFTsu5.1]
MITADSGPIRVEKGQADAEELAALTAVLLARAARRIPAPAFRRTVRRFTPRPAFHGAHSWQR